MNDCTFCASLVQLVAAIIFSLNQIPNYFYSPSTSGMWVKNTFLSNSDNASKALREELLTSCNLHTILDCPSGTFIGAGVKTVVLFFEKGEPFDAV